MTPKFVKTKPSFLEAGLPCASLSAECQRDNSASSRPPQNTLHIWWARRAPTICRAALLGSVLPHDLTIGEDVLPTEFSEPVDADLDLLPPRFQQQREFLRHLIKDLPATELTVQHKAFLLGLGIRGDSARALARIAEANEQSPPVTLGEVFGYRYPPAFSQSPSSSLLAHVQQQAKRLLGLKNDEPVILLDFMAGGGSIPLEGIRYGFKVYANDLNPVASLILKATLEYPTHFGRGLEGYLNSLIKKVCASVSARLQSLFPGESSEAWWPEMESQVVRKFRTSRVSSVEPAGIAITRFYLWCRIMPCTKCQLNIPLSTNFSICLRGDKSQRYAAFPGMPAVAENRNCEFRIVPESDWEQCLWPRLGGESWHPRQTPTYKDGHATCPRCGTVIHESDVKKAAQARLGGLPSQIYAVCSQVPVKVTYKDESTAVRKLWRFRAPTPADNLAATAAEQELAANQKHWAELIPTEPITPESNYNRGHRLYGVHHWREFFLPRQILTAVTALEEIRVAGTQARSELPPKEAEAVGVYLAFVLSKLVNYNSVNTFWHYGHGKNTQSFSRHDFAFRPAFVEMAGTSHLVSWGGEQVIASYQDLAKLVHGEAVSLKGADEEDLTEDNQDSSIAQVPEGEEVSRVGRTVPFSRDDAYLRPEAILPIITCNDAAALETPPAGTVHLICVDPPYYNNVLYAELSNFFYVWLKQALGDWPGLEHLFREDLAESNREAVANYARWKEESEKEQLAWQGKFDAAFAKLTEVRGDNGRKLTKPQRMQRAKEMAGPEPLTAAERADQFYEAKMGAVFRRAKQLLHPAGRMVVMFNHKMTKAWRALGAALIREGFEIRSSVPIHTEAESSLNIRGLDAARSTVLLLCLPRENIGQVTGNWGLVQSKVAAVARTAAERFQKQGLSGTDLYLSALGPALGELGRHWPITGLAGQPIDLEMALNEAYNAVARFRLEQILAALTQAAAFADVGDDFSAEGVDKNTQTLWLWLDTFQGDVTDSDDVQKLSKALGVQPEDFKNLKRLMTVEQDIYKLLPPQEVNLALLARGLSGEGRSVRGREAREADVWDERRFPGFLGAAVWNAIGLMAGGEGRSGDAAVRQWLRNSDHGTDRSFRGAFAVTLHLLRQAFGKRREGDPWHKATEQAGVAWNLVVKGWRG